MTTGRRSMATPFQVYIRKENRPKKAESGYQYFFVQPRALITS
jgi:hypothetical protein